MQPKSYSVHEALKLAIRALHVGKATGNRQLVCNCKEFIRSHWHMRNMNKVVIINV